MNDVKRVGIEEAQRQIQAGQLAVIDTRAPFDFFSGRISGAVNLPGTSMRTRKARIPPGLPLLIVAENDDLAAQHAALAKSLGFDDVGILVGGMEAWLVSGLPSDTISEGM